MSTSMEFDAWLKILSSVVVPLLLIYIGYRGIPPEKRNGAILVSFGIVGVIAVGAIGFVTVTIVMTPKWVAKDCATAYAEISKGPQAAEPTLAREPFLAGCSQLSMSAAECATPSHAQKFPASCRVYVNEIHTQLPNLDLKIPSGQKK